VEDHYADGISLRDVASAMSYTPAHLTYLFRRVTGKPLNAWIIEYRIREARKLLDSTNIPIGEICDAVGFGDLCYFSRQFQRHIGTTPKRYRTKERP
jgi:AraC-like DNA-binding protein